MVNNEIKYDGSHEEMVRLGLVDETGSLNVKQRNQFRMYMARVWEHEHPNQRSPYAEQSQINEETKEYLAERAHRREQSIAQRRAFWNMVLGHNR